MVTKQVVVSFSRSTGAVGDQGQNEACVDVDVALFKWLKLRQNVLRQQMLICNFYMATMMLKPNYEIPLRKFEYSCRVVATRLVDS